MKILILPVLMIAVVLVSGCTSQVNVTTNTSTNTTTQGTTHQVTIQNFAFSPASLTINKGDTVVWTNKDSAPHTVTSQTGNELSSQTLSQGQTYSHTFNTAGTYDYYCTIHPYMKATITVQ